MKPQLCKAQVQNDEYFCACCGLRWETSDQDYIPNCKHGCAEPFKSEGWGTPEFAEAAREKIEKTMTETPEFNRSEWDQKRYAKEADGTALPNYPRGMFQDAGSALHASLEVGLKEHELIDKTGHGTLEPSLGRVRDRLDQLGLQEHAEEVGALLGNSTCEPLEARKKDPGLLYKKGWKDFKPFDWGTLEYSEAREAYIEAMRKSPHKEVREMFQQISEEDEVMLLEGWSVLRRTSIEAKEKADAAYKKAEKFKRDAEIIHELVVDLEKLIDESNIT